MNRVVGGGSLLTLLALAVTAVPVFANSKSNTPTRAYVAPLYNSANETTLAGTILSVIRKPTAGMLPGAHLVISTSRGLVDAQLGRFGFQLRGAASLAPGQSVTVVGVMKTINRENVLIARLVQSGGQTIEIRTVRGFLIAPGVITRPSASTVFRGAR